MEFVKNQIIPCTKTGLDRLEKACENKAEEP